MSDTKTNMNKTEEVKIMEETKETKKRIRSANKTKEDKLKIIDDKIKYHEDCIESNRAKIQTLVNIKVAHEEEVKKLKAKREEIEKTPDRVTKASLKAKIKAKMMAGETLTPEETDFLMNNL